MDILRYSEYPVTPWKNGGGETREIMRRDVDNSDDGANGGFLWRLSLADVGQSGPFSAFDGYDRTITLLGGDGFILNFEDGTSHTLDTPHEPFHFDGGAPLQCELIDRMSRDLNLMVHRTRMEAQSEIVDLCPSEPLSLEAQAGVTQMIFSLMGGVRLEPASAPPVTLGAWDCAVLNDTDDIQITATPNSSPRIFHAAIWAQ